MAFNQQIVKSYASGATAAFIAPWAAFKGSAIALNTIVAGSTVSTAGLVITVGSPQFNTEWSSLVASVQAGITTSGLTVQTVWQTSNDGTNWATIAPFSGGLYTQVPANGTGALVTTTYYQAFVGVNPSYPYVRLAVVTGAQTGAAGDNVTVSYNWRKRSFLA